MTTLPVYGYDESGYYTGEMLAYESPREPGVYHKPKQSTYDAPPEATEGFIARWDGSEWSLYVIPSEGADPIPTTLENMQSIGLTTVDTAIGQIRLAYITEIPGQQMVYQSKEAEALAYEQDLDDPKDMIKYPYIASEATALGVSTDTVATTYLDLSAQWRTVGVQLEALRIATKTSITAAESVEEVESTMANFAAAIEVL